MQKPSKEELLDTLEVLLEDIPADHSGLELMKAIMQYINDNKKGE